jgi:hypothetical protein
MYPSYIESITHVRRIHLEARYISFVITQIVFISVFWPFPSYNQRVVKLEIPKHMEFHFRLGGGF